MRKLVVISSLVASLLSVPSSASAEQAALALSGGVYLARPDMESPNAYDDRGTPLRVTEEVIVSFSEVAQAEPELSHWGDYYVVRLVLTEAGRRSLYLATKAHVGDTTAMIVRGEVVAAPVVYEPIAGGVIQIDGHYSHAQAIEVASYLNSAVPRP